LNQLRFSYFFYVCAHVETMIPFFDEEEVTFSWKTWSNFVLYHIRLDYLFKRSLSSVSLLIRKDNSRCKILPFNPFPLAYSFLIWRDFFKRCPTISYFCHVFPSILICAQSIFCPPTVHKNVWKGFVQVPRQ